MTLHCGMPRRTSHHSPAPLVRGLLLAVLVGAVTVCQASAVRADLAEQAGRTGTAGSRSDWPQWRGPKRDGLLGAEPPVQWPAALKKKWEVDVGSGHSSPVVAGNRVVIFAREGEQEITRVLDLASGREVWRAAYAAPYTVNPAARAHGPGPKSTPAIANGRVFTFGIGGVLSAFDLITGKVLWRTEPPAVLPQYGTATSPLVDGGVVIVHMGGLDNGALTAFDVTNGSPRWQWKGDGPGYGSAIIAVIGGTRQLVTQTQKLMVGLDVSDGSLLWQLPFRTSANQNSVTPVVYQDLVIYSGLDAAVTAVRLRREGAKWTPEPVWKNEEMPMFMSSPLLIGTTLYGLTHRNRGQFFALDVNTGRTLWSTQGREGDNASLLGSRTLLLFSTTNGELIVARPNPQRFEEIRRYRVADSALWAHPAIAGRLIVVKDVNKVVCWEL
jgi:outer membrane protein assembly factor BamB